jgi:hypothetical protein
MQPERDDDLPRFEYAIEPLRGRRRWRWELWDGRTLAAAGWNVTERDALLAARTAASCRAHELRGLRALRPALARAVAAVPLHASPIACGPVAFHAARRDPLALRAALTA